MLTSIAYQFRQSFRAPAAFAYRWCTDFRPDDVEMFPTKTRRTVEWISTDALLLTDTSHPKGRALRIRRLVRLSPAERSWTNTHLTGPYRHSQFWYRIVADGRSRSHLEFRGLRLERSPRRPSEGDVARRATAGRRSDSALWRTRFAPVLNRAYRER